MSLPFGGLVPNNFDHHLTLDTQKPSKPLKEIGNQDFPKISCADSQSEFSFRVGKLYWSDILIA